jgi:hypothetical protein
MASKFEELHKFDTGATRTPPEGKLEYRRHLSPTALRRYVEFMHMARIQPDGALREPDNWKKGIPIDSYMDSLARHYMETWLLHDGQEVTNEKGEMVTLEMALCGILFNTLGYLHEILKENK